MEQRQTLETMISREAYEEIIEKIKKEVGEEAFAYIFPSVKRALEEGSPRVREDILIGWLDVDSVRICTQCGAIMQKGWYLDCHGYACSDECAAKSEGITMEEFDKWRIYKDDIADYLTQIGDPRDINELTKEECDAIIGTFCEDCDYYYTEWY